MVKYALTAGRGSRYGCGGVTGGAVAGRETGEATVGDPTLAVGVWRVVEEREKAGAVGRAAARGDPGATAVAGVGGPVGPSGERGIDNTDPEPPNTEGGRGLETDDDGPRPKRLLSLGGGGSMPALGADDGGIGSTVDCRWRYIPS